MFSVIKKAGYQAIQVACIFMFKIHTKSIGKYSKKEKL